MKVIIRTVLLSDWSVGGHSWLKYPYSMSENTVSGQPNWETPGDELGG